MPQHWHRCSTIPLLHRLDTTDLKAALWRCFCTFPSQHLLSFVGFCCPLFFLLAPAACTPHAPHFSHCSLFISRCPRKLVAHPPNSCTPKRPKKANNHKSPSRISPLPKIPLFPQNRARSIQFNSVQIRKAQSILSINSEPLFTKLTKSD